MRFLYAGLAALVACGGQVASQGTGSTGGGGTAVRPNYAQDVAPILDQNCIACHVAGGIAPFSLLTYQDAAPQAKLIASDTHARIMPPWHVDNSGACNSFKDARWLTDAQIATLGAWAQNGTPQGDPALIPQKPAPAAGLTTVSATLDMGASYTPNAALTDDYRCFLVDPGLSAQKYLTAYEVHPGAARVVHHVILYALASDQDVADAEQKDQADPGLGYTCFGGAGVGATLVAGWAPGTPATVYPDGTGLPLPPRKAVLQVHYNLAAGSTPDRTTVDLTLADSVPQPARAELFGDYNLTLPPNQPDIKQSASLTAPAAITIWGVFPHMHVLGHTLHVDRTGSATTCLVDVPRWDFHWQQFYFYQKPITIAQGDTVTITCDYDTMGQTKTVTFGEGTSDEMCINALYLTAAPGSCSHCGDIITGAGDKNNACPSAQQPLAALGQCACGAPCQAACGDSACKAMAPSSACSSCVESSCGPELQACMADK